MKTTEKPIVVEQDYNTSISKVWRAITERDLMIQWFFDSIPSFNAEVGFETLFIVQVEGRTFPHRWKVKEVILEEKLSYTWRFDGYPGEGLSTFELSEQNDQTHLKLTYEVLESFPDDIPEFKRESGVGGWNYFIRESLRAYLEKE